MNRVTWRQTLAFLPIVILILAYYRRIPVPPELLLLGDVLAYIDIFAVLLLLSMLSHGARILSIIKRATARVGALTIRLVKKIR